MNIDYNPFEGDGRSTTIPWFVLPGTQPVPVRRSMARELIRNMLETGHSIHSGNGSTLWILLIWLQRHRRPYVLTAHPGFGYEIRLVTLDLPKT